MFGRILVHIAVACGRAPVAKRCARLLYVYCRAAEPVLCRAVLRGTGTLLGVREVRGGQPR